MTPSARTTSVEFAVTGRDACQRRCSSPPAVFQSFGTGTLIIVTGARPVRPSWVVSGFSTTVERSIGAACAVGVAAEASISSAASATTVVVAAAPVVAARRRDATLLVTIQPRWPMSSRTVATIATVFLAVV